MPKQSLSQQSALTLSMNCTPLSFFSVLFVALSSTPLHAEFYPAQYQISGAGFNHSTSLQEKLTTTQGELFFKDTGLYVGASDVMHQDKVASDDHYEIDTYAGIKKQVGLFGYHLGIKSYNRAINKDIEVQEMYIGGNIRDLSFSYATNDIGEYKQINLSHAISSVNVGVHIGETKTLFGDAFSDWSIYASRTYKKLIFNAIMAKSSNPLLSQTEFNLGVERSISLF